MGGSGGCRCPRRPCSPRSHHPPGDHDRYVGACQVQPLCAAPRPCVAPRCHTPRVPVGSSGARPSHLSVWGRRRVLLTPWAPGAYQGPGRAGPGRVCLIAYVVWASSPHLALAKVSPVLPEDGIPADTRVHHSAPRRPGSSCPTGSSLALCHPWVITIPALISVSLLVPVLHFRTGLDTAGLEKAPGKHWTGGDNGFARDCTLLLEFCLTKCLLADLRRKE